MSIPKPMIVALLAAVGFCLLPAFWTPVTGDDPPAARQKERPGADRDPDGAGRNDARPRRPRDRGADIRLAQRGRNGQADRRSDRGNGHPLDPERIRRRLDILRQAYPEMAEKIERQLEEHGDNPQRLKLLLERLRRIAPHIDRWERMMRDDPKAFELELADVKLGHRARQLAIKVHRDNDPESEAAQELKRVIEQHFDVRQRKREYELKKLEQRIQKLRADLEARRAHRDQVIDKRFEEVMKAGSGAAW